MSHQPAGIILAAGKGTRMKSDLPKGLHEVAGLPMVELVGRAMRAAGIERIVVVIGHGGDLIKEKLGDGYEYVWQHEQLGTGHAALTTRTALGSHKGPVVIAPGDAPLLTEQVFRELLKAHSGNVCTIATAALDDPTGYGRIVRDSKNRPVKIVEEKDAKPEQKQIREVNVSLYCFDGPALYATLPTLKNSNAQGEYYLTDVVEILASQNAKLDAHYFANFELFAGVNDRWQLAQAERQFRLSTLRRHALNGVTVRNLDNTFVGPDVVIGADSILESGTQLLGRTTVGTGCRLGPNTILTDSEIGNGTTIVQSHVDQSKIGSDVWVGPFANIRPRTQLANHVKVGDFVELKNAIVGDGAKVPHLSYVGDAEIGARSNIGAGTITVNYDGFGKYRTIIGADAFVGSNSTLVAPRTIGDRAFVVAGSVITQDVPDDAGAFGRARQETKPNWAAEWREKKRSQT